MKLGRGIVWCSFRRMWEKMGVAAAALFVYEAAGAETVGHSHGPTSLEILMSRDTPPFAFAHA